MDTASPQPGHLVLPLVAAPNSAPNSAQAPAQDPAQSPVDPAPSLVFSASPPGFIPPTPLRDLWLTAEAEACGLAIEEFSHVLASVTERFNSGLPVGNVPTTAERAGFLRGLRLADLALAAACALGRELAWQRFLALYRAPLTQAAIAITGSATLGHDLADSLYAELYGLRRGEGERRSPLASYSGRGSLLGWLRTTLAQRHVDHHRRTRRETPLDGLDAPAPDRAPAPLPADLAPLTHAVASTLRALGAEDRFLLSAYFLDRQTLLQIARTLRVHEATVSRRIKRLTADLRSHLLRDLQSVGLSKRAAEEALGTDPRDLEINLRSLLQTSQTPPFLGQTEAQSSGGTSQPAAPGQL